MNTYIDDLKWRYATKKFDPSKKVSQEDLDILLEATSLSPSSYGLQPYHIFVIEDPAIREQLQPVSWGQSQITEASHLLVIANKVDFDESLIDDYLAEVSKVRNIATEDLQGYRDLMTSKIMPLPEGVKNQWTARQVYIGLGNLLSAAANLRIDACPMEGFEADAYNRILGLEEKGLNATVVVPVGYRSEEDLTQHLPKVRKPKEDLITII